MSTQIVGNMCVYKTEKLQQSRVIVALAALIQSALKCVERERWRERERERGRSGFLISLWLARETHRQLADTLAQLGHKLVQGSLQSV